MDNDDKHGNRELAMVDAIAIYFVFLKPQTYNNHSTYVVLKFKRPLRFF